MNQQLSDMNKSEHRHDEEAFSKALEILLERKKNLFGYPPPSAMNYQEIEAIGSPVHVVIRKS